MTARRAQRTGRKARLRRAATGGDRPYVFALAGLVVLLAAMALGPLQSFTAAADRVDALGATRDRLQAEVDRLEDRRQRLDDPDELEVLARADLGLVKPGEVPYVVVAPEPPLDQVRLDPHADARASADLPWYRRVGRALADLFGQ